MNFGENLVYLKKLLPVHHYLDRYLSRVLHKHFGQNYRCDQRYAFFGFLSALLF